MHRFPPDRRQQWIEALDIQEDLPANARICSCHFPDGDTSKLPSLTLGKRFASPLKRSGPNRTVPPAKKQKVTRRTRKEKSSTNTTSASQLDESNTESDAQITVNAALLARIELLEQEITTLKQELQKKEKNPFQVEDIMHDDSLVKLYTGFPSFELLVAFYKFLGPSVDHLNYWGTKNSTVTRQKSLILLIVSF